MSQFIVIGLYEDNGQTYAAHVEAEDPQAAMRNVAQDMLSSEPAAVENLIVLGAVGARAGGRMSFTVPDVDSGLGIYAEELVGGGDDNSE